MEETLGKRIAAGRKRLGFTQDKLAEYLGVTAQAVSKWENDLSCPDISILPKLADLFGITTDALLGREAPTHGTVHQGELVTVPEESDENEPDGFHVHNGNWEFHWDGGRKYALGPALLVLLVGGLMLAGQFLHWEVTFWALLWPSSILIFGLLGLVPRFPFSRIASVLIGGYYLIANLGFLPEEMGRNLIFPVLLLVLGLSMLIDALKKSKNPTFRIHRGSNRKCNCACENFEDRFSCDLSFGENTHLVTVPRLSGGEASVSFGELTVDLRGCEELGENCTIQADCSFGELRLLVPRRFRVERKTDSAFGSVAVDGEPQPNPEGSLLLHGSVSFGEISIHYI